MTKIVDRLPVKTRLPITAWFIAGLVTFSQWRPRSCSSLLLVALNKSSKPVWRIFSVSNEARRADWSCNPLALQTIQPNSRALSLASLQALARNSAPVIGRRGSSLAEMSFASSWGDLSGLKYVTV
jgi:hypothetical protein